MDKNIIEKLIKIKKSHEKLGFIILGIFGSYIRNEEQIDSDLDILYELTEDFYRKYPGWEMIPILTEIEHQCSKELGIKPDLVNKNALSEVSKKHILEEVFYV